MSIAGNIKKVSFGLSFRLLIGFKLLIVNSLHSQPDFIKNIDDSETTKIYHVLTSGDTLIEEGTLSGLPQRYGYRVNTNVCLDGICNQVEIWIYWDCIGRYEKFEIIPGKPLTKFNHELFTNSDYKFLNHILEEENYIFSELEYGDLVNLDVSVDAITEATRKDISHYVVEGAAFTCFALWNKVHGPLKIKVQELAIHRTKDSYLRLLLESDDPKHLELAILILGAHWDLQTKYQNDIIRILTSEDENISLKVIYSISHLLGDINFVNKILDEFINLPIRLRKEVIWQLYSLDNTHAQIYMRLIHEFNMNRIGPHELSLVIKMISPKSLKDDVNLYNMVVSLTNNDNLFVRRISSNLLMNLLNNKCLYDDH